MISLRQFSKLQTENAKLKGGLHEYEVLDRCLKIENTTLKFHLAQYYIKESDIYDHENKFRSKVDLLIHENRKLHCRLNRRYHENCILLIENRSLRKQLQRTGKEAT